MKKLVLAVAAAALTLSSVNAAYADGVRRNAYENAAGGITAGGPRAVSGPWGGRAAGEGGVVTNGDGAGIGASRGCAEGAAGGWGCRRGVTARDENGNLVHADSGYAEGPLGNSVSTIGGWTHDEGGDIAGADTRDYGVFVRHTTFVRAHDLYSKAVLLQGEPWIYIGWKFTIA